MKRRTLLLANYGSLFFMNATFYYSFIKNPPHIVDFFGILCLTVTAITFRPLFWKSGIWKLTHAKQEVLDEREIKVTQAALSESYGWFAVICLFIMLLQAIVSRLSICPKYSITAPLVASLIYLSHTLPGAFIAWRNQG